jgi:hypothetical protein
MKARILALAEALDVSVAKSVRNDECSTPRIIGRDGHAYADGAGFLIVCHPHRTAHAGPISNATCRSAASPRMATTKAVSTSTICPTNTKPAKSAPLSTSVARCNSRPMRSPPEPLDFLPLKNGL